MALSVEKQQGKSSRLELPDGLLPGLYLVVQPIGLKSWAVRYRVAGKPAKYTLGRYPAIKLDKAREIARDVFVAVAEGRDPGGEKKTAKRKAAAGGSNLFEDVARRFVERYAKANTRESSWRETERLLEKRSSRNGRAGRSTALPDPTSSNSLTRSSTAIDPSWRTEPSPS
jgi:hypothetical protein